MTCKDCKHFMGLGDFALCCDIKYGLCYEDTEACEDFEEREELCNLCKGQYDYREDCMRSWLESEV